MEPEKTRKPTLSDVARQAGVSVNAVSTVINGSRVGTRVSEATRRRIHDAAAHLRYHPNAVARSLKGRRMNTLGVVFYCVDDSPLSSPYTAPILDGIVKAAARHQQDAMLFTGRRWQEAQESLPVFCDGRCDGLLLVGPLAATGIVAALLSRGIPFVQINNRWDDPAACWVDVDDVRAARTLTDYLLDLGHRRIAMLCGDAFVGCVQRRLDGFTQAYEARDLPVDPALILPGTFNAPSLSERLSVLARLPTATRPTALFCTNDGMALEALRVLPELGLRVPEDLAVVGFDDIAPAARSRPPLTTMRQPLHELGERAVEILLAQIEQPEVAGCQEMFPATLVSRESAWPL